MLGLKIDVKKIKSLRLGIGRGAIWGGGQGVGKCPLQIFQGAQDSTKKGPLPAIIITLFAINHCKL